MHQPHEDRSFQQSWMAGISAGPGSCAGPNHGGCRSCQGPETD